MVRSEVLSILLNMQSLTWNRNFYLCNWELRGFSLSLNDNFLFSYELV